MSFLVSGRRGAHAGALLAAAAVAWTLPAVAAAQDALQHTASGDVAVLTLDESALAALGMQVVGARALVATPPIYTFPVRRDVAGDGSPRAHVDGGFALAAHDVHTGAPLAPLYLFDVTVIGTPGEQRHAVIRTADRGVPAPLEIRFSEATASGGGGELLFREEWARAVGRPELAGRRIGSLALPGPGAGDASLAAGSPRVPPTPSPVSDPPDHPRGGPGLDLELAELYQLTSLGREGTFPTGVTGFAAATTVCNVGDVPVPWAGAGYPGPMGETHPFVGFAMYRESAAGVLEMIGTSWIKHSYNVLASDKCALGCAGATTGQLNVGCSDTYNTGDNGTRYYLGPREELDPYNATWESCGSFFDASPADCFRDYFGFEASPVSHRLAVNDADLNVPGARFFYEAAYYVADDVHAWNGTGWRECSLSYAGGWIPLTPAGNAPVHGPLAASWGDRQSVGPVAWNDGEAVLSARVTALGGGQWHYEYVLYNWRSRHGVGALEIPVGAASVTNVGFRDPNGAGADDWTATVANGTVRWSHAGQPLPYQTLFNFRFDADAPPVDASAAAEAFGTGGPAFPFATRAPAAALPGSAPGGVAAGTPATADGPALAIAGANPAGGDVALAVTLPRAESVRLTVVDASGRTVRTVADRTLSAGRTDLRWDGRDDGGAPAAAGVYFVRLVAGGVSRTEKVTRLR